MAVQTPPSSGRWRALSPSVVEAYAWAASAAGDRPVNSVHLLFGLTLAHGERSEVRQLLGYFGEREDRLFAELPDLDSIPATGPPVPPLNDWPQMTQVADLIYTMASQLSTSVPFPDRKVHIPHLMAALIYVRSDAGVALEMALPPLPPFWLQQAYEAFLPTSASGQLRGFLAAAPRPERVRVQLIGRENTLKELDSLASRPGAMVSVFANPGSGATAVMLEFLQRSARRYRDGISYVNGMPELSDATLRVPDGRLVVVDHVSMWPVQMTVASTGALVVVGAGGTGSVTVSLPPLTDTDMREIASNELISVGVRPRLADVGTLLTVAAGRVDLLVMTIQGYPGSGRKFDDYLSWVASIPPGPEDRDPTVPAELADVYGGLSTLGSDLQWVLRCAVFLRDPLVTITHLATLSGIPTQNLFLPLEQLAERGLFTRDSRGDYHIPEPVARAARKFFAGLFEPIYFMRVISAATSSYPVVEPDSPAEGSASVESSTGLAPDQPPVVPIPPPVGWPGESSAKMESSTALAPDQAPLPQPPPIVPAEPAWMGESSAKVESSTGPAPTQAPVAPPPSPESARQFLAYTPTDYAADGVVGLDALGRGADVEAVCMLATLKAAKPPLSIGLFGEWGSGKTFFMRMVAERIKKRSGELKGGSSVFCTRIKHIWFNAWHYSDAEMWASLVTHIFEELAQEGKLTPPSIEEQKTSIDKKIKDLKQSAGMDAAVVLLRDKELKKELDKFDIHTDSLVQLMEMRDWLNIPRKWLQVIWPRLRIRDRAIIVTTAILAIAAIVFIATRRDLISLLAVVAPGVAAYIALFRTPVREILDVANRASQKLKQADEARQAEIARLESERRALDQPVEAFVQQRLASGDYAKRMGLISTARKDFEELSKRLAGSAMSDPDRIILYIDDLDRCPPKVVVQVLEAIHLLLAFELFVVIVGVDSRWLFAALEQHLLLVGGEAKKHAEERAKPQDYLEKIFQIPIQVKQMGGQEFATLVDSIVPDRVQTLEPPQSIPPTPPAGAVAAPTPHVSPVSVPATASNGGPKAPTMAASPVVSPPANPPSSPPPSAPATAQPVPIAVVRPPTASDLPIESNPEKLQLYEWEVDMLKRMSPLIDTPRSAKRLLNTYRLVRAGIDGPALRRFVPAQNSGGPYQAAILLLAIMIGFPDQFEDVFSAITVGADKGFVQVLEEGKDWGLLRQKVTEAIVDLDVAVDLDVFRSTLPLVSRYSFKNWEPR